MYRDASYHQCKPAKVSHKPAMLRRRGRRRRHGMMCKKRVAFLREAWLH